MAELKQLQEDKILREIRDTQDKAGRSFLIVDTKTGELEVYSDEEAQGRDILFRMENKVPIVIEYGFPCSSMEAVMKRVNSMIAEYNLEMQRYKEFSETVAEEGKIALFLLDCIEFDDYETWCFEEQKHIFIYNCYFDGEDEFEVSDILYAEDDERVPNTKYTVYTPSQRFVVNFGLDI